MRVLLLGATGNVGSRLLPSLVAHGHQVIVYVRTPAKLPADAKACASDIVSGSGTDSDNIKKALLSHDCDAVINAAGLAPVFGNSGELPAIFAAVTKAALEAGQHRGGKPLRIWLLSGFGILDSPKKGFMLSDYIPIYTLHKQNYAYIKDIGTTQLAWSLFCANDMAPRSKSVSYKPVPGADASNLVGGTESPPAWSQKLQWVPLLGTYLNTILQMQDYLTPLEDCVDFIANDLAAELDSKYVGHRVAVKSKSKGS